MKLTKRQLQRIIQEELDAMLSEDFPITAKTAHGLPATHAKTYKQTPSGKTKITTDRSYKKPGERTYSFGDAGALGKPFEQGFGTPSKEAEQAVGAAALRKRVFSYQKPKLPAKENVELEENTFNDLVQEVYKRFLRGN